MAATSFPRFLELPRELQIEIWKHTACYLPLSSHLFNEYYTDSVASNFFSATRPVAFWLSILCPEWRQLSEEENLNFNRTSVIIATARVHLKGTCRLARLIVLEGWRRDVSIIRPDTAFLHITVGSWQGRKTATLELLDGLIRTLMGGPV